MFRFYAETRLWSNLVEIGIGKTGLDGDRTIVTHVVRDLTLSPHAEGDYTEPTLRLSPEEARELMDQLWRCGVRPSSGEGNTGQLGATQKHLEDMRRLVFEAPKTENRERDGQ